FILNSQVGSLVWVAIDALALLSAVIVSR
ncbi:hypothetical protein SAMN05216267_103993, partial [Actinacidiphila rubida]